MSEEEQEDMEIGEDNTADEMPMNETVPVRQDGDRIVLKIRKSKFNEPEETKDQLKWSKV